MPHGLAVIVILSGFLILSGCGRTKHSEDTANSAAAEQTAKTNPAFIEERIRNERWKGDLDEIVKRRFVRVLVVPNRMTFFFDGGQIRGATYEAMKEFESILNKKMKTGTKPIAVVFIPVNRDQVIPFLAEGRGDIAAGIIGVSADRQKLVDFSDPVYDDAKGIAVTRKGAPPISKIEDLAGKEIYLRHSSIIYKVLEELSARFVKEGRPAIKLVPGDENLDDDDVLEMVNAGIVPMTVTEDKIAAFWAHVFDNIQSHPDVSVVKGSIAWAMQKNTPQLSAFVNEFIKDHKVGTSFGNTVLRKYLQDTKYVSDATSKAEIAKFGQMVALFRKFGDQYDFPYLLVAAQAFQESRLDQNLKSPAGAVGVMQIKPDTAASKPIEIPDVYKLDRNIEAGVKYLRFLMDRYYANEPMTPVDKGLFAIASYNAGPAKIARLRKQAQAEGFDPNKWFNNVEVTVSKEIGRETVQYVANVYKYYLAYKLVTERNAIKNAAKKKVSAM